MVVFINILLIDKLILKKFFNLIFDNFYYSYLNFLFSQCYIFIGDDFLVTPSYNFNNSEL